MKEGSARQPAHQHDGEAHQKHQKTDFIDAVHHAQADARFGVPVEQVDRVQVVEDFL